MVEMTIIFLIILLFVGVLIAYYVGYKNGVFRRDKFWESEIPFLRKEAIEKSRSVLGGQFSEQLAPFLPNFKYSPTECRFIGKPIDFLVFRGMDGKDINEIVFVEVKSGKSKLSSSEKKLKETIDKKRIRWEEYRIDEEITKNKKEEE